MRTVTPKQWPELCELLRPLSGLEMDRLRESLERFGCVGPPIYVLPDGRIIDGHHRFSILGTKAPIEVLDVDDATGFALGIAHNEARRNLTPEQLKQLREQQKTAYLRLRKDGKTQHEAAAAVGIPQQTGSDWERGSITDVGNASTDQRVTVPKDARRAIFDRVESGEKQSFVAADYGITRRRAGQIAQQEKSRMETEKARDKLAARKAKPWGVGPQDVLVIDPPWPIEKINREVRPKQGVIPYPTMSVEEIMAWPDEQGGLPCATNAHVWLWTTHRFLPAAFKVLDAWSLKYVCTFVWHKPGGFQPVGLPQYNAEFALYARRGSPKFVSTKGLFVCFSAPRGDHSEKPDEFYEMIRHSTSGKRLDMFARRKHDDGFTPWGNEVAWTKDDDAP